MSAAMKRPAAASVGGAVKKSKAETPVHAIEASIMKASKVDSEILKMVASTVSTSLSSPKDTRSQYAEKCLDMVNELLQSVRVELKTKVSTLEQEVGNSEQEKSSRIEKVENCDKAASEKSETLKAEQTKLKAAKEALAEAKKTLKMAEKEMEDGNKELDDAAKKKESLDHTINLALPKRTEFDGSAETDESTGLKEFIKALKAFKLPSGLIDAASTTFGKPVGERRTFDSLVIVETTSALKQALETVTALLAEGEALKATRTEAIEKAKETLKTAEELEKSLEEQVKTATSESAAATTAKKEAEKAAKSFEPELKKTATALAAANKELKSVEDTIASFNELRERVTPPPPAPVETEEVPVTAEADTADAAVVPAQSTEG